MTLQTQWFTMLLMLGSGFFIGIILDFYRVLTVRFRIRKWLISLIDLIYWMVSAVLVFGLLFWSNWGELRFYFFVAVCLGFLIYFKWASRPVLRGIRMLFHILERIFFFLARLFHLLIFSPARILFRGCRRLAGLIWKGITACIKLILSPFFFLLRPVQARLEPWLSRRIQKGKAQVRKIKAWWNKNRDKGE